MRAALLGALGIAIFLAAWEVIGRTQLLGISWPPLSDVLPKPGTIEIWTVKGNQGSGTLDDDDGMTMIGAAMRPDLPFARRCPPSNPCRPASPVAVRSPVFL